MDSRVSLWLDRAENEISAANLLIRFSKEESLKKDFKIPLATTFYSNVIGLSYYSIFYAAKAALLTKGIEISSPNVHKRAIDSFKKELVDTGLLDKHFLEIYEDAQIKASDLLQIMKKEKKKRGRFTYRTSPQANLEPAEQSLANAKHFVSYIKAFTDKNK